MPIFHKYELPPCLEGIMSVSKYDKLLNGKADTLRERDMRLNRPYAMKNSKADYKAKIHAAFLAAGPKDPYTGDTLRYDLLGTPNSAKDDGGIMKDEIIRALEACARLARDGKSNRRRGRAQESNRVVGVFDKGYFLKPVVDHSDPRGGELEFEICSWIVNSSKTLLTPEEYVELCRKIAAHATCPRQPI